MGVFHCCNLYQHFIAQNKTLRNCTTDDSECVYSDQDGEGTPYFTLIILVVFLLLALVTLLTSIFTIYIIVTTARLRTYTNAFVVSMATSDVIFACISLILLCDNILDTYDGLPSMGQLESRLATLGLTGHIYIGSGNILLIALHRWLFLTKPFFYQSFVTKRKVTVAIALTWVISLVASFPACWSDPWRVFALSHLYVFPALHGTCFLLLILLYGHILFVSWRHINKMSKMYKNFSRMSVFAESSFCIGPKKWRTAKFVMLVCGLYVFLTTPYVLYQMCFQIAKTNERLNRGHLWLVCNALLVLSHFSNFFVYSLKCPGFKSVLKKKIEKLKCFSKTPSQNVINKDSKTELSIEKIITTSCKPLEDQELVSVINKWNSKKSFN